MDKQNLMPQAAQPIHRTSTGQLPAELAELSEEALSQLGEANMLSASHSNLLPSSNLSNLFDLLRGQCSYDGDDAE